MSAAPGRPTVLIVDDVPANIHVLNQMIRDEVEVLFATSGERALAVCAQRLPDLVLLDVLMPGMDGIEVCRRLKADPRTHDVPVIVVTAQNEEADERRALDAGAIDFLTKPVSRAIVHARVRNHLELKRQRDELRQLLGQLRAMQDQVTQSEKMAAVGQLATGVAHEVNGPLGIIRANLGVLGDYAGEIRRLMMAFTALEPQVSGQVREAMRREKEAVGIDRMLDDVEAIVRESLEGAERMHRIVEELGERCRVEDAEWQFMEPTRVLENALALVGGELSAKADVVREYGDVAPVRCRPLQLGKAFSALLTNAGQAIATRGTVSLRTGLLGGEVHVDVVDTGCGISRENVVRIFEPFFTTRGQEGGRGLGLSMAQGIVQEHGGRIEVESEPGRGSCFRVYLPVAAPAAEREP